MKVVAEVDVDLGLTRVVWIGAAQDVGKAINPQQVEGQIEGGTAQGLGLALMEEIQTRDGLITNASFTDYLIPTTLDMPPVESVLIEDPEPDAPYGVKGVGEPPTVVSTAAIVAALRAATGRDADARPGHARRHLPLSPAQPGAIGCAQFVTLTARWQPMRSERHIPDRAVWAKRSSRSRSVGGVRSGRPRRLARERRQRRPALEHPFRVARARLQVVVEPDRVEPELLHALCDADHRLEVAPCQVLPPALRDDDPELHATIVPGSTSASGRSSTGPCACERAASRIGSSSSETTTSVPTRPSFE